MPWSRHLQRSQDSVTGFPLFIEPKGSGDINDVLRTHQEEIEEELTSNGAVLFRGFRLSGDNTLNDAVSALGGTSIPYVYRSTSRTGVTKGVYTATEYPPAFQIPMHNEEAYQRSWPMRLAFHCVLAAASGGQTPLAKTVQVTSKMDQAILKEFRERGVRYVRNYQDKVDLPWHEVFQTTDKAEVERYCQLNDIKFCWTSESLKTIQICQGTAVHPITDEEVWFNQSQLFHVASLGPTMATNMLNLFGEPNLPRNAYFGDGARIPDGIIEHVRNTFEHEKVIFDWRNDDLLIIDNMKTSHGRNAFTGQRRVLVTMWAPFGNTASSNS